MTPRGFVLAALALGAVFALLYQFGMPIRATYGARVNVDEPFYLLTTASLLADGDVDLRNDYALRRYRAFFDHQSELWYQSSPVPDGGLFAPHNIGLSVLILPAYALGGVDGVKAFLGLLGGVVVALAALVAQRATGRSAAALVGAALIASTAPIFVYATQIYPELPAAGLLLGCVYVLLGPAPRVRSALVLAVCLTALVWLGSKYAIVGGMVALLAMIRLSPRARWWLVALGIPSALGYAAFHISTYGGLTPYSVNLLYAGRSTPELVAIHFELWNRLYRLAGLWIDAEFGLVRWAPVLLLVLPALAGLARRRGPVWWILVLLVGTQVLVATFLSITMRGWWFPGRMLVPVLPLLAIPLALAVSACWTRVLPLLSVLALGGCSVAITVALVVAGRAGEVALAVDPFLMPAPWFAALGGLFPLYTEYTAVTWLLTAGWIGVCAALVLVELRPVSVRWAHSVRVRPAERSA